MKMTSAEMEEEADRLLQEYADKEHCPKCNQLADASTDVEVRQDYFKDGKQLILIFRKHQCECGEAWHAGYGERRGYDGDAAMLTPDALMRRKKPEIHTKRGTPDPSIVSGLFFRSHPEGRAFNPDRKNGRSYYSR